MPSFLVPSLTLLETAASGYTWLEIRDQWHRLWHWYPPIMPTSMPSFSIDSSLQIALRLSALGLCLLVFILVLLVLRLAVSSFNEKRKIQVLGGLATARLNTWAPFGLDFLYTGLKAASFHQIPQFWRTTLANAKKPAGLPPATTIDCRVAGRRFVFTIDPENVKALLATQFNDYGKSEIFHRDWKDFLGDSIFTTDGELWHNSRQLIRPQFIKDRVSDLAIFEKHVQILIGLIPKDGQEVDISDLFFRYTLDAATDFLLGKSSGSLENSQVQFAEAFAEAQRVQNIIIRAGPLRPFVPKSSFRRALQRINEFVEPFIERALCLSQQELDEKTKSDEGYTFLHALAGFTRNRKVLRDQLVAVLLAGRDTTAATLSFTFHELSKHPEVVARLRREILEHLGPDQPPTYVDLKNMRYLQHIMSETLRLYPVVPFNMRFSVTDTTLPRGGGSDGTKPIGIPRLTAIGYSALLLQQLPQIYASQGKDFPDPQMFVPDRFERWTPKAWTYIPFNGGPRICVGQQWACVTKPYFA
jgi:cytochrome P450